MTVSIAVRRLVLGAAALLALGASAHADRVYPPPPPPPDVYYPGPPILRNIPGLRILFGDYALTEDEYNSLYGQPPRNKKRHFDESYYVPEPVQPGKKPVKPAKPATGTTATTAPKPANQVTASAPQAKPPAQGALSCEKATEVVSGYGFSSVEAANCAGKIYAFNARRGGKSFAIKLDPASGELTEVKKLP